MSRLNKVTRGNFSHYLCLFVDLAVSSGFNVVAKDAIGTDTSIISCPFSLAITPGLARQALIAVFEQAETLVGWNERQLVCTYISMHWVLNDSRYVYGVN